MGNISNTDTREEFKVIDFAKDILNEVNSIRSFRKESDDGSGNFEQVFTESRLNAFFRLIGLPMFVKVKGKENKDSSTKDYAGEDILTPGFSKSVSPGLSNQFIISNNAAVEFVKDAELRESFLSAKENSVGTQATNADMLDALQNPITKLEANVKKKVGNRDFKKDLKPLITLYLKDGVLPKMNELARPFLSTKDDDMIDSNTRLSKPFIETVVHIRLVEVAGGGNTKSRENAKAFKDSIKKSLGKDKNGNDIFDTVFARYKEAFSETDVREDFIIGKLLSSLQLLANKWVNVISKRDQLKNEIDYTLTLKTTSAKSNPFGKRASVSADLTDNSSLSMQIKAESERLAVEESYLSLLNTSDETRNTTRGALDRSFGSLINNSLIQIKKNLENLKQKKKKQALELDRLRLELEMMTGEFTGLSIPDVVIVMTALFMISDKDLIGLLDELTMFEMEQDTILKKAVEKIGASDHVTAVENLGKVVDDLYSLLNYYIDFTRDRKNKVNKVSKNNRRANKKLDKSPPAQVQEEKN